MKTIAKGIDINKKDLYLNVKVKMGTEVLVEQKGNSLLFPFLAELACSMNNGTNISRLSSPLRSNVVEYNYAEFEFAPYGIPDFNSGSTGKQFSNTSYGLRPASYNVISWDGNVVVLPNSTFIETAGESVQLQGGAHDGVYKILSTVVNGGNIEVTVENGNFNSANSVTGVTAHVSGKLIRDSYDGISTELGSPSWTQPSFILRAQNIFIGSSDHPVSLEDRWLYAPYPDSDFELPASHPVITTPTIANQASRIALTQTFTNVSGASQTVREIGLSTVAIDGTSSSGNERWMVRNQDSNTFGAHYNDFGVQLIARDLISPIVVAAGETISVTYEIVTEADGTQGVVAGFNELLYRQLSGNSRVVRTIFNRDWDSDDAGFQFDVATYGASNSRFNSSLFGIQVGTHNQNTVDIDDYYIRDGADNDTRIPHGKYDNSLYYLGTRVEGVYINGNEAYVQLEGYYENKGSVAVTINEVGLNVTARSNLNPVLIARNILQAGEPITLQPGEMGKVEYRISISTGA